MSFGYYRQPFRRSAFDRLFPFEDELDYPFSLMHYHMPYWRNLNRELDNIFYTPEGRYYYLQHSSEDIKEKPKEKSEKFDASAVSQQSDNQTNKDTQLQKSADSLREIFPFSLFPSHLMSYADGNPFQVNVNLAGCDPAHTKVDIKDGVIKVEGKQESDKGFVYVKHEQTLPKEISPSSLKASFRSDGTLSIRQESVHNIPVTIDGERPEAAAVTGSEKSMEVEKSKAKEVKA